MAMHFPAEIGAHQKRALVLCFLLLTMAHACHAQGLVNLANTSPRFNSLPARPEDPSIPNSTVQPVNLQKPRAPQKAPKVTFFLLSGLTYAAAGMDMHDTTDSINRCRRYHCVGDAEGDPLARPFTHMPAPAYYASGYALATGVNWLAWKMGKSQRWQKVWWLPQGLSISLNTRGIYTHHH